MKGFDGYPHLSSIEYEFDANSSCADTPVEARLPQPG
jgi:hypothetical protein